MKDIFNLNHIVPVITPVVVTDNTAQVGAIIDRQGFDSLFYAIVTGTLADADATFAVTMDHGDKSDLSDAVACGADDLIGATSDGKTALQNASFDFSADGKCRKLGYRGGKRYTRLTITPSANTGNAPMAAVAVLGHANVSPTANPPQ